MYKFCKFTPKSYSRIYHKKFHKDVNFGVCFDVDGVIATGPVLIPGAKEAISKLVDAQKNWKIPVAFVTNSSRLNILRTDYLSQLLDIQVKPWQVIQAPSPLEVLNNLSDKFCLAVEQKDARELANENGFKNVCTLEELSEAYPLLDMVDSRRKNKTFESPKDFPKVEGVLIMGEPIKWERALQMVLDLLRTDGKPTHFPDPPLHQQLPLIVCNFDMQYKSRASIPRFGNGAFLTCLEALHERLTGRKLVYSAVLGKPAEITMRYVEYVLERYGKEIHGQSHNLHTLYMVGDAHKIDIVGINRYQKYINQLNESRKSGDVSEETAMIEANKTLPNFRQIPTHNYFLTHTQNVKKVEGLLVRTGVYKNEDVLGVAGRKIGGDHFLDYDAELEVPEGVFHDVNKAVDYILENEHYNNV